MIRTQIYLSTEQWKTLHALSFQMHQSMADLIRGALDRKYLLPKHSGFETGVNAISGLWAGRKDSGNSTAYIRALRKDTRLKRQSHE